jgi:hypothetical protein
MSTEDERAFDQAMLSIYQRAKLELGYNASRFLQMLEAYGGLATPGSLFTLQQYLTVSLRYGNIIG